MGEGDLILRPFQSCQHPRMTCAELVFPHHVGHFVGQVEQTQQVGNNRTALAQACGDRFLRVAALLHQGADRRSLVHGIQILTLKVLD